MTDATVEVPVVQEATAQMAIGQATPFAELLVRNGLTKRGREGIHIVVAQQFQPAKSFADEPGTKLWVEQTVGKLDWQHDYHVIAQGKTNLTLRFERPTDQIPLEERDADDPIYWGSVWNERLLLAIGASGFQPEYDRAVCQLIEANILLLLELSVDLGAPRQGLEIDGDKLVKVAP